LGQAKHAYSIGMNESATSVANARVVERLVAGLATSDGASVKLTRVLTQDL
jgi:quercetin 2,3-dioxygenase